MERSPRREASLGTQCHGEMEGTIPVTAEPGQRDSSSKRAPRTDVVRKRKQNKG